MAALYEHENDERDNQKAPFTLKFSHSESAARGPVPTGAVWRRGPDSDASEF